MSRFKIEISYSNLITGASFDTPTTDQVTVTIVHHGYYAGDIVEISGVEGMTGLNGIKTIVSAPTADTFVIALEASDTYTGGGIAIVWWDVSDFVYSCDEIPIWKRNINYEVVAGSFNLAISATYGNGTLPNARLNNVTDVRFSIDNNACFIGSIEKSAPNYDNLTHEYTVFDGIIKLKNYLVDYATLNSTIASYTTGQYTSSDNEGFPNARARLIVQGMFDIAGFPSVEFSMGASDITKYVNNGSGWISRSLSRANVLVDLNMLYAINQSYAINTTKINSNNISDYDTLEKKITFWDFVNAFCSHFRMTIHYGQLTSGDNGYWISYEPYEESRATIDDDIFGKIDEEIPAQETGYKWMIYGETEGAGDVSRSNYADTFADNIISDLLFKRQVSGGQQIQWLNNLVWLVEDTVGASLDVVSYTATNDSLPIESGEYSNFFNPNDGVGSPLSEAITSSYTKTTLTAPVTTTYINTVVNEIDIENQQSKIIQVSGL